MQCLTVLKNLIACLNVRAYTSVHYYTLFDHFIVVSKMDSIPIFLEKKRRKTTMIDDWRMIGKNWVVAI